MDIIKRLFKGDIPAQANETTGSNNGFGVPDDTRLSGWFRDETGELFEGFPILASDRVIDVGCGDAPFIKFCANQGAEVIFADIDEAKVAATEAALQGSEARKITPIVSNCAPIPLPSNYVDKVISMEVLEHVEDPAAVMAELVRVGKPGSMYLITVPDAEIENLQKNGLAPDEYFQKPNHIRIFARADFRELVNESGLEILKCDSFGFYWSMWWVFFWACKQDLAPPWHPLLKSWTNTWSELLTTPDGARIKRVLDDFMPKTQLIIARKPQTDG